MQNELLDAAQELFARDGYENVTIDQIVEAVGVSRRSFFRYFRSKEAVVLGKYDRQGEQFVEALQARPSDEHPWVSLRRVFDGPVAYMSDPVLGPRAMELQRTIDDSETLRAGFLERMQRCQDVLVDHLLERAERRGEPVGRLEVTAVVAAAFAALSAAGSHAQREGLALDVTLDEAMDAVAAGVVRLDQG
ncbi:TetR/AcrR family transcriptional regulator [Aquipuribacter sp. MA13-6]|uniref:TetR/AcrR family transcriptional regulator n=1 Tax=unclassified Aquipuribacter TaxID=2635084 RepID=UPI003EEDDCE8